MANFDIAHKLTLDFEGGYSNDPQDAGGETYKGIARTKNPAWDGWRVIDNLKKETKDFPKNLDTDSSLQSNVKQFYKKNYWDALLLDSATSQDIANECYDTSVNMGVGKSVSFMIEALNLLNRNQIDYKDIFDKAISEGVISVLNAHKRPQNVLKTLNGLQFEYYHAIVKSKPEQEKFFNGWLNRVW